MDNFNDVLSCMAPLANPHFTGAVGIGTASPGGMMQVTGTVLMDSGAGSITAGFQGEFGDPSVGYSGGFRFNKNSNAFGDTVLSAYHSNSGSEFAMRVLSSSAVTYSFTGGNVGIGTTTPQRALSVSSGVSTQVNIDSTSGSGEFINFSSSGVSKGYFGYHDSLAGLVALDASGATVNFIIKNSGNVGIGTASPAEALTVVGNIRTGTSGTNGCVQNFAGTALTGTCSSDSALKTVTGRVRGILDSVASLELVRFRWNTIAAAIYHNSTSVVNTGFLAQDVERQFPELISRDVRGYRQLDYTTLSLYGLEAIKELKGVNDRQAAEIVQLRALLAATRERLEATSREQSAVLRQIRKQLAALERRSHVRTARN